MITRVNEKIEMLGNIAVIINDGIAEKLPICNELSCLCCSVIGNCKQIDDTILRHIRTIKWNDNKSKRAGTIT